MEKLALKCLQDDEDERARSIMSEKADVQYRLEDAEQRVKDLVTLEVKLQEAIDGRRTALGRSELASGKQYTDEAQGVSIVLDDHGKPTFQRTSNAGSSDYKREPDVDRSSEPESVHSSSNAGDSSTGPSSASLGGARFSDSTQPDTPKRTSFPDGMELFDLDDMLNEGDRRLDKKFLELERQQLERSLSASTSDSGSNADAAKYPQSPRTSTSAAPSSPPSSTSPPSSLQQQPRPSPWDGPPPGARDASQAEAGASARGSGGGAGAGATGSLSARPVVAEWWTMGQNALMDGALAALVQEYKAQFTDAADALQGVTNARMSGQDPSADKLKSLLWHSLRSPEQHGTGAYWGAQHAPGSAALSNNVKLAVFGHALQVVVEDLLMSDTKMLARGEERRPREARAALVALASALRLGSAAASDFSVQVVCRAARTCILNAHTALRAAYDGDKDSMPRAEADLWGLHKLLQALPVALPVAMGHAAAKSATDQLRRTLTAQDAKRLQKLYNMLFEDDSTSEMLDSLLEPITDA